MSTLTWYCVDRPADKPRWIRSAAMDDDGTIYAPAVLSDDNEMAAMLKAGWDGDVPVLTDSGHVYLPTWWLAREYPHMADLCRMIESRLRAGH